MKKLICLFLVFCMIPCLCFAEIDLSSMSFDELSELSINVVYAMIQSDDWFSVTIPMGLYQIGVDIPAGRYTVCTLPTQQYSIVKWGNMIDNRINTIYGGSEFIYGENSTTRDKDDPILLNIILSEGQWLSIENGDIVLSPYIAPFTFK